MKLAALSLEFVFFCTAAGIVLCGGHVFKSLSLHLHIFANYLSSLAITGSRVEKKKFL